MSPASISGYEFGEFVLIPSKQLLLHLEKPINLLRKELAILSYLVEHANEDLSERVLIDRVWGAGTGLAAGNVSHHIAKIRKVLGCEARKPKYIRTLRAKRGYRFIAEVVLKEFRASAVESIPSDKIANRTGKYSILAHLFVPVFLGAETYGRIGGEPQGQIWGEYKEFKIESGSLFINSSGFGTWHLPLANTFRTLHEAASWRKRTYNEILNGKHRINLYTKELTRSVDRHSVLNQYLGKFGYVFSAIILNGSMAKRSETTRNILKILSNLSSLESISWDDSYKEHFNQLERHFLQDGFESGNIREFGLAGIDLGFASWDGTSYLPGRDIQQSIEPALLEFEIAVQSLWWMCKCLMEMERENIKASHETVRKYLPEVKRQFSIVKNIAATESPSQRTMTEGVIETSRIRDMVEQVLELNN